MPYFLITRMIDEYNIMNRPRDKKDKDKGERLSVADISKFNGVVIKGA